MPVVYPVVDFGEAPVGKDMRGRNARACIAKIHNRITSFPKYGTKTSGILMEPSSV